MSAVWPTHRLKATQAKKLALRIKKRNRKIRRLYSSGKRGEMSA